MQHRLSEDDRAFRSEFEACRFLAKDFNHRAHLRLAYIYLTEEDDDRAHERMRDALLAFVRSLGIDVSKYHETLTRAWILAVRHFMSKSEDCPSADDFLSQNPRMLDSSIMLKHYSTELLFSDEARAGFVEPNLIPIPRHSRDSEYR